MIQLQKPKDNISKEMLASVPRKMYLWLRDLEKRSKKQLISDHDSFTYGKIGAVLGKDSGSIDIHEDGGAIIVWTGLAVAPTEITVGRSWMTDISNNLDSFIKFEQTVYDELERLEKEINYELLQTSKTESV